MSNVTPADDAEVLAAWLNGNTEVLMNDDQIAALLWVLFWRLWQNDAQRMAAEVVQ